MGDFLPGVHEAHGLPLQLRVQYRQRQRARTRPALFSALGIVRPSSGASRQAAALDSLRALRSGDVTEAALVPAGNLPGGLEAGDNSQEKLESPDELLSTAAGGISALEPLYPSRGRLSRRLGLRFGQDAPPPGIRSRTCQSRNRTAKREWLTLGAAVIVRWVSNLAGLARAARKMLDHRWVSTSKNDVERGESNGTMAGLALRLANAHEESRIHGGGRDHARARHRCEHGHLQ